MKSVIVVAATVASSVVVLPTVSQGQTHHMAMQAHVGASSSATVIKA